VTKPGYESVSQSPVSISDDTTFDLTLRVGISVLGDVTELGVGPLDDVAIEVVSGLNAGRNTLTGHPIAGRYLFDHMLPGEFTLRASKMGYDAVEQTVRADATISNVNFLLKWSYGTCLQSVSPVVFDPYPSAGGTETVVVNASAGRRWTVIADPWIEILSPASQTGSGQVRFRVTANASDSTNPRRGAVMIRCSASEGQNVWITQNPACHVRLESAPDSPAVFDSEGGIGHLLLHVDSVSCRWTFTSQTDWIRTSGITEWNGDLLGGVRFVVSRNTTGIERVGTVVLAETTWQVRQR
jgi:hypothetical protein